MPKDGRSIHQGPAQVEVNVAVQSNGIVLEVGLDLSPGTLTY